VRRDGVARGESTTQVERKGKEEVLDAIPGMLARACGGRVWLGKRGKITDGPRKWNEEKLNRDGVSGHERWGRNGYGSSTGKV